ncbi:hypothetical protein Chor_015621, partial [Crotalus horridus]
EMDWTGAILTLLLFILAIMFRFNKGSSWNNSVSNLPPGPRTIPILGNLHMMDLKKPYKTMMEWSKEYGPIFRIRLGFQEMVVLTGYETVKEALVNQGDAFAERASIPFFENGTKGFEMLNLYNLFPMLRFLLATPKSMIKNQNKVHDFIQTILKQYLQDLDENDQSNLIESFLVRQREENMKMKNDGYFRNENLLSLVDDLFGAGTETMANTMRWAILLMMKYPEIQSKVQEEIAKEIGDLQPTIEDRAKMPHTDAVIHEIQRPHGQAHSGTSMLIPESARGILSSVPELLLLLLCWPQHLCVLVVQEESCLPAFLAHWGLQMDIELWVFLA